MSIFSKGVGMVTGSSWIEYALVVLLAAAIFGAIFRFGDTYGYNKRDVTAKAATITALKVAAAEQAELQTQIFDRQNIISQLSGKLAVALSNTTVTTMVVHDHVLKEVKIPVYDMCIVPKSGTQLLHDIATKYNYLIDGSTIK